MGEVRCYLCHGEGDSCPRCGGKGTIELAGIVGVMTEEGIEMSDEPKKFGWPMQWANDRPEEPKKCPECKGKGIFPGDQVVKCPDCRGHGGHLIDNRDKDTSVVFQHETCERCKGRGVIPFKPEAPEEPTYGRNVCQCGYDAATYGILATHLIANGHKAKVLNGIMLDELPEEPEQIPDEGEFERIGFPNWNLKWVYCIQRDWSGKGERIIFGEERIRPDKRYPNIDPDIFSLTEEEIDVMIEFLGKVKKVWNRSD